MQNKPNFFIVGAAKAGTTSVYNYLNDHPDVFMSPIKEPNFFGSDIKWENFREDHKRNTKLDFEKYFSEETLREKHIAFVNNEDHYLDLFRNSGAFKVRGEASTSYLYSSLAAKEIYDFNPEAKIIIILREPVERTVSHYLMDYARGNQKGEDILDDIKKDFFSTQKGYCVSNLYIDLSLYNQQIQRYIRTFPAEQIILLHYEDLKKNPNKFMSEIFSFIDVRNQKIDISQTFNATQEPKNRFVRYAFGMKNIMPFWLKRIIRSQQSFFFKPVSKQLVPEETLSYIKSIVQKDWEKVKPLIKSI